ncbi:hypothetical protein DCW30_35650 [Streptomyces alfalfae]|uniref:DUF1963 domain-containing protein n=1 Tax=Streptomyces alfalfae TaxID=1642299 RepID=A0ABM6H1P2_9ACTN|nr:hypothetical protein [Streptomyces alfalfae]AYA20677.1 hypothetical protein D3X13_34555 [Streptomyces fradiae]APY90219.1 hypothetical protein A7J05_35215 [Streptomyces alfalfae]QUI29698.1 hypothetical protein H9W91_01590 [Streptomyces alfalfae]RXX34884.1 hypothetical protein DCW30_35650 [Streptomyces alfalfae]RZM96151.1 hypothetical protein D4104_16215 [Streptomyces alfalfae]
MDFVRTTPPRPVQVAAVFPELAPLARPAIRLHPRPGSPSVRDSSVGGPLLWPAGEPWPHCEDVHLHMDTGFRESLTDVRLQRRLQSRWRPDDRPPAHTPEEEALKERDAARLAERLDAGPPFPADCPVPLLPVAQLFLCDIPLLRPPGQADLLQVLWCPYEHEPDCKPATALFWRSAAEVDDILATPPEPYEADYPGYVPEPCVLAPEAITEYPNSLDLSPELQRLLEDWNRWQAAGADVDSFYAQYPREFYSIHLGNAPGWKVGGWPPWGRTDPYRRHCAVCEAQMVPLLTIASWEWSGGEGRSWAPQEDQAAAHADARGPGRYPSQPTRVEVGSTDNMQIYVCPRSPEHPHTDLIQ